MTSPVTKHLRPATDIGDQPLACYAAPMILDPRTLTTIVNLARLAEHYRTRDVRLALAEAIAEAGPERVAAVIAGNMADDGLVPLGRALAVVGRVLRGRAVDGLAAALDPAPRCRKIAPSPLAPESTP